MRPADKSLRIIKVTIFVFGLLAASPTRPSAQAINSPFEGVWRCGAPHSELTIESHQREQQSHVEGNIIAAIFDRRFLGERSRVTFVDFSGTATDSKAELEWRIHRSRAVEPHGTATLSLSGRKLSLAFRYEGDEEIWIPEHAELKPGDKVPSC